MGKLNLPKLLLRVGLLTLINMDSLIYLDKSKSSQAVNRQATLATRASQAVNNSQAGRLISPRASPQASQVNSTPPLAESAVSQAGNSQTSLVDSTLSQAESTVSQAGNSRQASPRLPWQITLFPRQRVQSPRQVSPRLPQVITLFPRQRVQSPRLAFPRQPQQSGAQQGLGPHRLPPTILRQAIPLGQTTLSHSQIVELPKRFLPRLVLPRRQNLPLSSRQNNPQGSSSMEEPNAKWEINLFSKSLTKAQRSVLAKGPNFAVSPRHPPNLEYITAIEAACTKLS